MITTPPNTSFEATVGGMPTGLTGTIGVRILDNVGGTTSTRVTTGIAEFPSGSGFYTKTFSSGLSTAGQYTIMWDTGSVSPSTTAQEDLLVTATAAVSGVVSAGNLTSLDNARLWVFRGETTTTSQDNLLTLLINTKSEAIRDWTQREFTTSTQTRTFDYDGSGYMSLAPYELRTATSITVTEDNGTSTVLTASDYRLDPPGKTQQSTYLNLEIDPQLFPTSEPFGLEVAIAGDWGMAAVPAAAEEACLVAVDDGFRNPGGFSSFAVGPYSAGEDISLPGRPLSGLPPRSRSLLRPFVRHMFLPPISFTKRPTATRWGQWPGW
jgi:hypothetical protein